MNKTLMVVLTALCLCLTAKAQIYSVAQLNADQIRALDKQKTAVILTGGILEQHGPHLPSFTDGYSNEWLTKKLAEAIVARPGWAVLLFPTIPLGHGGANDIGGKYAFPGTYTVRRGTLRAIFMDLATELGEQGFRWVFVMHGHGAPFHNLVLDQAGDYFRDTYGGKMVHLRGLEPTGDQLAKIKVVPLRLDLSEAETKENGLLDLHAGLEETSRLMFIRPDLVSPSYRTLPPFTVNTPVELFGIQKLTNWTGYLGSPRLANAKYGSQLQEYRAIRDGALALAILDGVLDEREIPRYATRILALDQMAAKGLDGSSKYYADIERKQHEWMKKRGIE